MDIYQFSLYKVRHISYIAFDLQLRQMPEKDVSKLLRKHEMMVDNHSFIQQKMIAEYSYVKLKIAHPYCYSPQIFSPIMAIHK